MSEEEALFETLGLEEVLPEAQEELDGLGESEVDPQEEAESEALWLGLRLPDTVLQMVGEVVAETVLLKEVQPDAVTDAVPEELTDALSLTLTVGDTLPLSVCVTVPVEQDVGVTETLAHEETETDTVVHPEGLKDGEPVVEPLTVTVPEPLREPEGELDTVPVEHGVGE